MKQEQKIVTLQTVIETLEKFNDLTVCGMAHEENGTQCPDNITDRRIGCPHHSNQDILRNSVLALLRVQAIKETSARRWLQILHAAFESIGRMDDTKAGAELYYDVETIPDEQEKEIDRRDRSRLAFIRLARRCLHNTLSPTQPQNSPASPAHTPLS